MLSVHSVLLLSRQSQMNAWYNRTTKNMKFQPTLLLFVSCAALWLACQNTDVKTPAAAAKPSPSADSVAVADIIHNFYKWYDGFSKTDAGGINFTDATGKHLKLDQAKMEAYFTSFKNSGFISQEFIDGEYIFYKKCEKLWQNEFVDDVPSGMDADKYFCAQDWELEFWTSSPVRIKSLGPDKIAATLYGTQADAPDERNFELKKENGKWVIVKIECDMGVQ